MNGGRGPLQRRLPVYVRPVEGKLSRPHHFDDSFAVRKEAISLGLCEDSNLNPLRSHLDIFPSAFEVGRDHQVKRIVGRVDPDVGPDEWSFQIDVPARETTWRSPTPVEPDRVGLPGEHQTETLAPAELVRRVLSMYEVSQGTAGVCQVNPLHASADWYPESKQAWLVLYDDVGPALKHARSARHGPMGVSHVPQGDPVASVPESIRHGSRLVIAA